MFWKYGLLLRKRMLLYTGKKFINTMFCLVAKFVGISFRMTLVYVLEIWATFEKTYAIIIQEKSLLKQCFTNIFLFNSKIVY